jgi:hypothetical protein
MESSRTRGILGPFQKKKGDPWGNNEIAHEWNFFCTETHRKSYGHHISGAWVVCSHSIHVVADHINQDSFRHTKRNPYLQEIKNAKHLLLLTRAATQNWTRKFDKRGIICFRQHHNTTTQSPVTKSNPRYRIQQQIGALGVPGTKFNPRTTGRKPTNMIFTVGRNLEPRVRKSKSWGIVCQLQLQAGGRPRTYLPWRALLEEREDAVLLRGT